MASVFQKLIYDVSLASPLLIVFALVWYIQKKSCIIPLICVATSVVFIICLLFSFSYGKKHLAPIQIRINHISPKDNLAFIYVFTYILPFASIVIDDYNPVVFLTIAILIILVAAHTNTSPPNPILLIKKYHFYSIDAGNGVGGYVLISKRKLRKKQDLKAVNRVFEFLLLDSEE